MPAAPRLSILVPNYNNGRGSANAPDRSLLEDLLGSLQRTLADDPTPFEVIALDDGSTDDSLNTLREWSTRRWLDGRPMLTLIERPHTGVLAKTSNELVRAARGDILVRLDGDITCETPRWVSAIVELFDRGPADLGVVGPRQLASNGRLHAAGDFILHPKGYVHVGQGLPADAIDVPVEVDHVMGAFYCFRRAVYERIGGFDEQFLRGQTIDFGLRSRLAGFRCFCVPHVAYTHHHGQRGRRSGAADTEGGVKRSLDTFERKWGFNRLAADLDAVAERYAGTPLLWNARVFGWGGRPRGAAHGTTPLKTQDSVWGTIKDDAAAQRHVQLRVQVAADVVRQTARPRLLGVLGAGDGVVLHALAAQGLAVVGLERDARKVALGRHVLAQQRYPGGGVAPRLEPMLDDRRVPLPDGAVDLMLVLDVMEEHPNPAALVRELRRVVARDGHVAFVSRRGDPLGLDPRERRHFYTFLELHNQLRALDLLVLSDVAADDPKRDIVIYAKNVRPVGAAAGDVEAKSAA